MSCTDKEGHTQISKHQYINKSEGNNVKHGSGVYLTDLSPGNCSNNTQKKIAQQIYGNFSMCFRLPDEYQYILTCQVHPALVKQVQCTVRSSF